MSEVCDCQGCTALRAAAAEIARPCQDFLRKNLTLTDAEREAVERAAVWMMTLARERREIQSAVYLADDAATLRSLLARLGGAS